MLVYGSVFSPFVSRVVLALRYKGIKFNLEMPKNGMKSKEYLSMNPFGKMPLIKDNKNLIPESSVILEYLDIKYSKKGIIPKAVKSNYQARLSATICDLYIQSPTLALFRQRDPKTRDKMIIKEKLKEVNKGLSVLDERLDNNLQWVNGKSFSIADCYALPALFFVQLLLPSFINTKDPFSDHKKVKRYWNRLKKHAYTKDTIKEMNQIAKNFIK